jgi:hypothetical protein
VDALLQAGFAVRSRSADSTLLVKGLRSVFVPTVAMLTPDEMSSVLRDAGLAYSDFLEFLSETPTEPDLLRKSGTRKKGSPEGAATG